MSFFKISVYIRFSLKWNNDKAGLFNLVTLTYYCSDKTKVET